LKTIGNLEENFEICKGFYGEITMDKENKGKRTEETIKDLEKKIRAFSKKNYEEFFKRNIVD